MDKEQEIERSKLFKAPDATNNMRFKEYKDHDLKNMKIMASSTFEG